MSATLHAAGLPVALTDLRPGDLAHAARAVHGDQVTWHAEPRRVTRVDDVDPGRAALVHFEKLRPRDHDRDSFWFLTGAGYRAGALLVARPHLACASPLRVVRTLGSLGTTARFNLLFVPAVEGERLDAHLRDQIRGIPVRHPPPVRLLDFADRAMAVPHHHRGALRKARELRRGELVSWRRHWWVAATPRLDRDNRVRCDLYPLHSELPDPGTTGSWGAWDPVVIATCAAVEPDHAAGRRMRKPARAVDQGLGEPVPRSRSH
jgi:hypothetical protein